MKLYKYSYCLSKCFVLTWMYNSGNAMKEWYTLSALLCSYVIPTLLLSISQKLKASGPWLNIKMSSYQYRKSHCGDKTILRPPYLHNGNSYTGKTTSLYWIGAQMIIIWQNPRKSSTFSPSLLVGCLGNKHFIIPLRCCRTLSTRGYIPHS